MPEHRPHLKFPPTQWQAETKPTQRREAGAAYSPVMPGTTVAVWAHAHKRTEACSEWAHPVTVVAGTTGEGAALVSVRFVGVSSASHCGGGHYRLDLCSVLGSLGRHGLIQPL
jgi:hypothetical protein